MKKKKLVIYGGSFNPPGIHHQKIAQKLSELFDLVIVYPCGERPDKPSANIVGHEHRKKMVELAFSGIRNVEIDMHDLEEKVFTRNHVFDYVYKNLFPEHDVWHFVGGDILKNGRLGQSEIHRVWLFGRQLWEQLNYAVCDRPGYDVRLDDMPPKRIIFGIEGLIGSATTIRNFIRQGKPIDELVDSKVASYIEKHKLYRDKTKGEEVRECK